jgi:DNA-binding CsgD family transcriptional regulator
MKSRKARKRKSRELRPTWQHRRYIIKVLTEKYVANTGDLAEMVKKRFGLRHSPGTILGHVVNPTIRKLRADRKPPFVSQYKKKEFLVPKGTSLHTLTKKVEGMNKYQFLLQCLVDRVMVEQKPVAGLYGTSSIPSHPMRAMERQLRLKFVRRPVGGASEVKERMPGTTVRLTPQERQILEQNLHGVLSNLQKSGESIAVWKIADSFGHSPTTTKKYLKKLLSRHEYNLEPSQLIWGFRGRKR